MAAAYTALAEFRAVKTAQNLMRMFNHVTELAWTRPDFCELEMRYWSWMGQL